MQEETVGDTSTCVSSTTDTSTITSTEATTLSDQQPQQLPHQQQMPQQHSFSPARERNRERTHTRSRSNNTDFDALSLLSSTLTVTSESISVSPPSTSLISLSLSHSPTSTNDLSTSSRTNRQPHLKSSASDSTALTTSTEITNLTETNSPQNSSTTPRETQSSHVSPHPRERPTRQHSVKDSSRKYTTPTKDSFKVDARKVEEDADPCDQPKERERVEHIVIRSPRRGIFYFLFYSVPSCLFDYTTLINLDNSIVNDFHVSSRASSPNPRMNRHGRSDPITRTPSATDDSATSSPVFMPKLNFGLNQTPTTPSSPTGLVIPPINLGGSTTPEQKGNDFIVPKLNFSGIESP